MKQTIVPLVNKAAAAPPLMNHSSIPGNIGNAKLSPKAIASTSFTNKSAVSPLTNDSTMKQAITASRQKQLSAEGEHEMKASKKNHSNAAMAKQERRSPTMTNGGNRNTSSR